MSDTSSQQPAPDQAAAEADAAAPKRGNRLLYEFKETLITIAIFVPFWLLFSTFVYELRSIPSESMVPALQVGDRVAVAKFAYGYNRNSVPFGFGMMFMGDTKCSESPSAEQAAKCVDADRMFASLPKRGDVIVFQHPHQPDRVMIKRLIGLPGDTIQMKEGRLYLNGIELPRDKVRQTTYVPDTSELHPQPPPSLRTATEYKQTIPTGEKDKDGKDKTKTFLIHEWGDTMDLDETPVFKVPPGHVFMMGDNRDNSEDSRAPSGHPGLAAQFPAAWPYRGVVTGGGDPKDMAVGFVPLDDLIGRAETVLFTLHGCTQMAGGECPEGTLWKGL